MKIIPKAAALLAALFLLTTGCGFSGSNDAEQSPVIGPGNTAPLPDSDAPASIPAAEPSISAVPEQATVTTPILPPDPTKLEAIITLDWQEAKLPPQAEESAGIPAGAETVSVQRLKGFGGTEITFYTLPGDEDYVYANLRTSGAHYSLGPAGTYNYRKAEDLNAAAVSTFNGIAIKITGGLGANSTLSSYYTMDKARIPAGILQVDTGHTHEADVDRDGNAEVVSAHGTPMAAYVYRWHDGHAEEAYLNDALQADSVVLRDDLIYEAADVGESEAEEYRLTSEGLILQTP